MSVGNRRPLKSDMGTFSVKGRQIHRLPPMNATVPRLASHNALDVVRPYFHSRAHLVRVIVPVVNRRDAFDHSGPMIE
jgi:hypothetical protein